MDHQELLRRSDGPVSRGRLVDDLTALGLRRSDTVLFHTRLSALGYVAGGADVVLDALADVVGPQGTLVAFCGWNDAVPYDFGTWPARWQEIVRAEHPAFNPARSEAEHANGRLPESLRRRPGAVRSRHPDISFAALGPSAEPLLANQPWDDPHGPDSPLARLAGSGGRVLLLGAPLDTVTLLHHAEAIADAPGKRFVRHSQPILVAGERVWREFHDIDSERGAFDYEPVVPEGRDPFEVIMTELLTAGSGRTGRVGAARSHLFEAAEVVEFGVRWLERRFGG
ncbi:aminoglycoside 3-N-acetyltransferase [Saccharomonospora piscinae]|uniref:aminoglycoside 3-N-acetyltransferase n=1 Tax=Saccharomonospora piscinae TaxID=687388 RepID=UPI00110642FD|nr:aminoglycoside 3-N-acetyltransferase [Saccharomonospora piscinae]TLW90671.1 aminoglycoside 3-N-acetyltransferase [Saccharomonospora piscinae]